MKISGKTAALKIISACLLCSASMCSCSLSYNYDGEIISPSSSSSSSSSGESSDSALTVSFLDIGQGDSIFVELPNGETMLIDAGVSGVGETIEEHIEDAGFDRIDYLVATHPHADHIGSMKYVVENIEIGKIYMTDAETDTKTFEKLLESIDEKGYSLTLAEDGTYIVDDGDLSVEIIGPSELDDSNLNNCSIVIKLTYKEDSYLFTGDAEEEELEQLSGDIGADVLKVGHHGSRTSTGEDFLERVNPKYAVISCGEDNDYGHPHSETLNLLEKFGIEYYRTDEQGDITITSHGNEDFSIKTEK